MGQDASLPLDVQILNRDPWLFDSGSLDLVEGDKVMSKYVEKVDNAIIGVAAHILDFIWVAILKLAGIVE